MGSDLKSFTASGKPTIEHFRGWMRVRRALDRAEAAAMRDVVLDGLPEVGVQRDAPGFAVSLRLRPRSSRASIGLR